MHEIYLPRLDYYDVGHENNKAEQAYRYASSSRSCRDEAGQTKKRAFSPPRSTSYTQLTVLVAIFVVLITTELTNALSCYKCLPRKFNNWCSEGFGPEEQCWAQDSSCLKVDFLVQAGGVKRRIVLRECVSDTYLTELDTVFINMKHANDCILHRDDAIAILLHGNRRSAQLYDTQERTELANVVRFGSELLRAMDQGFLHSRICRCNTPLCNAATSTKNPMPTNSMLFRSLICVLPMLMMAAIARPFFSIWPG